MQGARDIRPYCLNTKVADNPAAQSAALMALALQDGKNINDTFVFNSELESLGKWYRQLLGESIGKEHNLRGEQVHSGITPTVSVGSTDLHSVGQLYLGGPKDKLTTFVYSSKHNNALTVPSNRIFPSIAPMIDGKTTTDIMQAILGGTKIAYNKNQLPFIEI
jgi:glucose-6-phosphate isomerase